jgi:hypothetical protein
MPRTSMALTRGLKAAVKTLDASSAVGWMGRGEAAEGKGSKARSARSSRREALTVKMSIGWYRPADGGDRGEEGRGKGINDSWGSWVQHERRWG